MISRIQGRGGKLREKFENIIRTCAHSVCGKTEFPWKNIDGGVGGGSVTRRRRRKNEKENFPANKYVRGSHIRGRGARGEGEKNFRFPFDVR